MRQIAEEDLARAAMSLVRTGLQLVAGERGAGGGGGGVYDE